MRPAAHLIFGFAVLSALPGVRNELHAQESSATLEIIVRSLEDNRPLGGAQVVIEGVGIRGITNSSGFLRVERLPAGARRVTVNYLGYAPMDQVVSLAPGRPNRILVQMGLQPIALAPVTVRSRRSILLDRGFYDRQRSGLGTFLTRADIEDYHPRFMSDVLRRTSGIQVGNSTFGSRPSASIRGASGRCPIQYFVDGAMASNFNIDEVTPWDVEGLEIYRGAATVPPAYKKGTSTCGVILIWTRID
ncbi:MAG: TonB-dependent receptor plug domain-containing protein [Gemmatimonadota bacterium]